MKQTILALIALWAALVTCSASARRELPLEEATQLVTAYLTSNGSNAMKLAGFEYDKPRRDERNPRFYVFNAVWNNPGPGSVVIGNYLIDSFTGDVWDGATCTRDSTLALQALQKKARRSLRLGEAEYRRLQRQVKPCGW